MIAYSTNNKKNDKGLILATYLIITVAIYLLPLFQYVVPYILAALLMLSSLFLIFANKKWLEAGLILLISAISFLLLDLFVQDLSLVDIINETIRHIRYFIPVFWTVYAIKYCNEKEN